MLLIDKQKDRQTNTENILSLVEIKSTGKGTGALWISYQIIHRTSHLFPDIRN